MALNGHDRAVACVAKRQHMHYLAVKSFFNQLMWILRPRRKLKRIARKFHLRPLMATWLAETASSFEVFHAAARSLETEENALQVLVPCYFAAHEARCLERRGAETM